MTEKFKAFADNGIEYKGQIEEEFDVIVVGSGPGGYLAAEEAGKSGLKTLIIEKEFWGGVCLNVGCIPTKALLASTATLENIINAAGFGIIGNFDKLNIDYDQTWIKMHERKKGITTKISGSVKMLMKASKCKILEAEAKFVGSHEVEVEGKVYRGKNIIMAMGSLDRKLDMLPGFKESYNDENALTSKEAINYGEKRPSSITIVGGGVIGVEFAQVFASVGTKVTIIQNMDRLLPGIDLDIAKEIAKKLTAAGVEIIFNASSTEINSKKELVYKVNDEVKTVKSDVYLIAVGRVPVSEGLEQTGVIIGQRKEVVVDEQMKTNVKGVYAIGDLTGKAMLAHVAYNHALIAVQNILGNKKPKFTNTKPIPGCIYTHPEIAFVGMTEEKAKEAGKDVFTSKYLFGYLGKAIASQHTDGFAKLVVDKDNGQILGAHFIGANSTDYIAELTLAIEKNMTVDDLTYSIHPHPTYSEIVWECARSASLKLHQLKK
ncbi:dihydrolipoyl dehydrogenase [Mycoplasma sp. Mirounga ES2805-ORL]|uniref:dihydrolipoyl dehydrogenase n=1 Tax=Mycoplasma sp. Mirounga ES2805-ORL TaxID=754514 RepID=UPI00197C2C7E|nr:dihydrolipoyl dehydrogenase [Mycoplasma sp. Mirounga ES2805-ORL]QSF13731.1 dihydrolipoyl dehydrogenase [Mycoplasma sp. Mirounga ES2805-ORL]